MTAEALLRPLDAVRRATYRAARPLVAPWMRRRELRVAVMGVTLVAIALGATVAAPLVLLALGPIVLGVPHVVADLRYLVAKPELHRRGPAALAALGLLGAAAVTGRVTWGLGAAAVLVLAGTGTAARKAACTLALGAAVAAALALPRLSEIAFAHAHNFLAVVLWWAWRKRTGRAHLWPLAAFGVAFALLVSGALDGALASGWQATFPAAPTLGAHSASLAPFADEALGARLVAAFAFAQSVHYGIWLRLVPEEARERAPRSFASSWRALAADLGPVVLTVAAVAALGVAIWAAFDLAEARTSYLRFAIFHAHIEVVALALLASEGRRALDPGSACSPG